MSSAAPFLCAEAEKRERDLKKIPRIPYLSRRRAGKVSGQATVLLALPAGREKRRHPKRVPPPYL